MSWKHLEGTFCKSIYSSWSRRLEDVFWRRRQKTSSRRLQDVFIKTNVWWLLLDYNECYVRLEQLNLGLLDQLLQANPQYLIPLIVYLWHSWNTFLYESWHVWVIYDQIFLDFHILVQQYEHKLAGHQQTL